MSFMKIREFIAHLEQLNFTLTVKNDKLILQGDKKKLSKGALNAIRSNEFVINFIKDNKNELIQYLSLLPKGQQLEKKSKDITAIYRLSGLQQGMLFHGLYDAEAAAYIEQFSCDLIDVDLDMLNRSWAYVINAHSILRTSFNYDAFKVPVQLVHKTVKLPVELADYRSLVEAAQAAAIKQYEDADRAKGFDFNAAPLMRIGLIRLTDNCYRMIWTSHHILFDGWSMPILMGEFLNSYESLKSGKELLLKEEDRFEDYIRYIGRIDKEAEEKYWRGYFKGLGQNTFLPFIKSTTERNKGLGDFQTVVLALDTVTTASINRCAKSWRLTVNTIMQGVWAYLLHNYTGNDNISYGVTVSGRPENMAGIEQRVGMYINTLALHSGISPNQPVSEWLQALQEDQVNSRQFQYTPIQVVQDWSGIKGDLFDTMLTFENYPVNKLIASKQWELKVENIVVNEHTNYPLSLLIESTDQINIRFSYNVLLLHQDYVNQISSHFENVLMQVISAGDKKVGDIDLLTGKEKQELLSEFNNNTAAYPLSKGLIHLFEEQLAKTPESTAIIFQDVQLSYQQLEQRSSQLANYLKEKNIKPGMLVPLCMDRGIDMVVGILGILKTGAAYVPIDADYPHERIRYILEDTGAEILVSNKDFKEVFVEKNLPGINKKNVSSSGPGDPLFLIASAVEVVCIDDDVITIQSFDKIQLAFTPNNIACVIYTSGSSGRPKGVKLTHAGIINRLCWMWATYPFEASERNAVKTSISFVDHIWEIFGALNQGVPSIIFAKHELTDLDLLISKLAAEKITRWVLVPSLLRTLLNKIREKSIHLSYLKYWTSSGESLPVDLVRDFYKFFPPSKHKLLNIYGSSEVSADVTCFDTSEIKPEEVAGFSQIPVGKPISNILVYILNKQDKLVAKSVAGEICIAGVQVALGYLNLPELTAQRFITNVFSKDPSSLIFKTGDFGRWLPDGNIEYLGRIDSQVKIRGNRVEIGEIENVLQKSGLVQQCIVLTKKDTDGNIMLAGYFVAEGSVDKYLIIQALKDKLPDYMVPFVWLQIDSFALLPNGKINKMVLPDLGISEKSHAIYIAPRNKIEIALADIWQKILLKERIGIHDDFFELGGHSLLAMRVVSIIRKELLVEITMKTLFNHPTIAALAAQLEQYDQSPLLPLVEVNVRPVHIPLSFTQERVWFIDKLEGSIQYHLPAVLKLKGKLNKECLNNALQTILQRHEVLRTIINYTNGEPYQKIIKATNWKMFEADRYLYKNQHQQTDQYIREFIMQPFNLSADYMFRATLIETEEDTHILAITMHHIACDGWSLPIIVKELVQLYRAYVHGLSSPLVPLQIQYADYAIWQRNYLQGEVLDGKLKYWKEKLKGISHIQLPTDFPRPLSQSTTGKTFAFSIDKQLTDKLQVIALQERATLFMTLLAAFKTLLYRYSGQTDICVGTPVAGRQQIEVEDLVGFFANTLALRTQLNAEDSFTTFLSEVKQTTVDGYEHQDAPLEKIVELVVKERDISQNPLFQVMFVLQNIPTIPKIIFPELNSSWEMVKNDTAKFDISFYITETDDGLQGSVEYCTALYKDDTISRMINHYKNLLGAIVKFPHQKLGLLQLLSTEEEHEILVKFNETKRDYPDHKSVVLLFEEQVAKTPDALAVLFEEKHLSYLELNKRANQLANYLKIRGVKAQMLVPICVDRSFEMIVGILGILKTGAAFVPIDPKYPIERIYFMLSDSRAKIIVSTKASKRKLQNIEDIDIIEIDGQSSHINNQSVENLHIVIPSQDLAYVIHTSGSTGMPKGVMIEHRAIVNLLKSMELLINFNCHSGFLSVTTFSFDICYLEFFLPLINGARLFIIPREIAIDGFRLARAINAYKPSHLQATPATWQILLDAGWENKEDIKILIGGEEVKEEIKNALTKIGDVYNLYGPTETTIWSVSKKLSIHEKVLIGKPIANTSIYILGKQLELVPVGVIGEICIGGAGLSRGYLNRPDLTNQKFIPNPFNNFPGAVIYKSGDLGRWLPDGSLECLGRIDDQVKIRGYRIELGEIESVLINSGLVNQAVVLVNKNSDKIVGYFTPNWSIVKAKQMELLEIQIERWKVFFESAYTNSELISNEKFNISFWKDSFKGSFISEAQMQEWLEDIIRVILSEKTENVLEIGCGTGLVYDHLAGRINKYTGTDFSPASINQITKRIQKGVKNYGPTTLKVCAAHEISIKAGEQIDTIIMNSVIQYFPCEQYMDNVIDKCISLLNGSGRIIIGDVRDNRLLEIFKVRLQLQKMAHPVSTREFMWAVEQEILKEEELCFCPEYFYRLRSIYPQISNIEIKWKDSVSHNEFTLYRYTVVIYLGRSADLLIPDWQNWDEVTNKESIIRQLSGNTSLIALVNVPDFRLRKERSIYKALSEKTISTVGELLNVPFSDEKETEGIEKIIITAKALGYQIRLLLNDDPFKINLVMEKHGQGKTLLQPYVKKINDKGTFLTNTTLFAEISSSLQKELKALLKKHLPDYMIPSELIAINKLPLTNNGKIDRVFLISRKENLLLNRLNYLPPQNDMEHFLAFAWQELLHVKRIGVNDNFFELGGHSLLAMRIITLIRKKLGLELSIKDLFFHSTISTLAAHLLKQKKTLALITIPVMPRPEYIPLSFNQERLYFIDRLEGSVQYHLSAVIRIKGQINIEALNFAIKKVVGRHEVLRSVLREQDGRPYQYIISEDDWNLSCIDGEKYLHDAEGLNCFTKDLRKQPFNISKDFMLRGALISMNQLRHLLVVTLHHIASDGWSISVLVNELVELYSSFVEKRDAVLIPIEIQYADYAIWQRTNLESESLIKKIEYWKTKLQDVKALYLPTDYQRPLIQSTKGSMVSIFIDKALSKQLQVFSTQNGTTLFMTLIAAFKVLLYRYTGQNDICIGTAIAGRQTQELETLIGFFVNTLALRNHLKGNESFVTLLQQVKDTTLEAYENQEVPFEKVVESMVGRRDLGTDPLIQIMFSLQNTPDIPILELGQSNLVMEAIEDDTALFELWLNMVETPNGLSGSVKYCTDLYSRETIERFAAHFKQLLQSIINESQLEIAKLQILSEKEINKLIIDFNDNAFAYPNEKNVVSLFEEQVEKTPNKTAITFGNEKITYNHLNERSNQVASFLYSMGVKPGNLVPVFINRSVDLIIVILGILKSGAAYVPIDPDYPVERVNYMLSDIAAEIVICNSLDQLKLQCNLQLDIIALDMQWEYIIKQPKNSLKVLIEPHSLVYVIYTSGSSGNPKGVMVEHGNVVSLVKGIEYVTLTEKDILLSTGSPSFDATTIEYWGMLLNGGELVLCSENTLLDNDLLKAEIVERRVTKMWFTSSWFNQLVANDINIFKTLQTIMVGGEKLFAPAIEKIRKTFPYIEIINGYGPTENTTFSLTYRIQETVFTTSIPIGKPLNNRVAFIVDRHGQLVPVGVPGEIWLGGAGLARGYLNMPELTAEKFVVNPFQNKGSLLYKTGDQGKWLEDGTILFIKRMDEQVKIRGYRIELGEIEVAMNSLKEVDRSCVVIKTDSELNNKMVAYYLPSISIVKAKERQLYTTTVANWKELYEIEYAKTELAQDIDPEFNIVGWNDSFTNQPIPPAQMREWLNDIMEVIMFESPERVLEIGSGTGLIYYQLAGKIKKYIGTDFSNSSINQISEEISKGLRDYGDTELHVCAAHEVSVKQNEEIDTVILNSIVQYFPGEDYMTEVIGKSIDALKGSGRIIVGDVRDNRLLEIFKGRLLMKKIQDSTSIKEFKWATLQEVLKEEELCFSPAYFFHLKYLFPQITHVDIKYKQGNYINELTLYRFNVIIYVGNEAKIITPEWMNWESVGAGFNVLSKLKNQSIVALTNVPNPRLWKERLLNKGLLDKSFRTVGDLAKLTGVEDSETISINNLLAEVIAEGFSYRIMPFEDPLKINLVFEQKPLGFLFENSYNKNEINQDEELFTNVPLLADITSLIQKEIRFLLHRSLPDYMLPAELIAIAQLPLTNNGKVDREFLSQLEDKGKGSKLNYVAPRNNAELAMANIWQQLLGLETVSIHDNFFEIGGHSLLATRVKSAIRKQFDKDVTIKDIFIYPTIALLSEQLFLNEISLFPAIEILPRPAQIPLSFSQERLWFIDQLEGSIAYNSPAVLRLKGKLSKDALIYALQNIISRHEVLRTIFAETDGRPFQKVIGIERWNLSYSDQKGFKDDQKVLKDFIEKLIIVPFDLSKDYMLRANLINLGQDDHVLVITIHHIAYDGWSLPVIIKEVEELYNAFIAGKQTLLPKLPLQYADYALWQRKYLQGKILEEKIEYWKNKLEGVQTLQMPTDYSRPVIRTLRGASFDFLIDRKLSEELNQLSQQQGTTLFMTLLGVYNVLLNRYTSQQDICVGTSIANRPQQELEGLIGFFVNTLALRTIVHEAEKFTQLLQQIKITTLDAYEHQDVPFEKVVEAVVKNRDPSRSPLFQVMLVLLNTPQPARLGLGEIILSHEMFENKISKFDITFHVFQSPDGLPISIEYNTDLFGEDTIIRMAGHFVQLLNAVIKDPKQNIDALQMLTEIEEQHLLVEFE